MSNNINDTCAYQVSYFLNSDYSFEFPLDAKDISILRTMADYMDMSDKRICFLKQSKLIKISRVPLRTLIKHINKLIDLKLIIKEKIGILNHYKLGNIIIKHVQQWHMTSAIVAHDKCSNGTSYNKNYNKKYNESCYAPVDNQSTSYKEQKIKRSTKEVALSNIVEIRNKLCKINT